MHPYSSTDTTATWKKLRFILSFRSDFYMTDSLSIVVMPLPVSVDETLPPDAPITIGITVTFMFSSFGLIWFGSLFSFFLDKKNKEPNQTKAGEHESDGDTNCNRCVWNGPQKACKGTWKSWKLEDELIPSKLQHCLYQPEYWEESWRSEETYSHSDCVKRTLAHANVNGIRNGFPILFPSTVAITPTRKVQIPGDFRSERHQANGDGRKCKKIISQKIKKAS